MEACEGGTVLVKLNLQPGAGTSTAELRRDPVLRQALVDEFCGRCVEGAGARPTPTTKALLASFFPGLSQDSHDLIKPLNGSLLVSADVACPLVPAVVASDQIKTVRTIAPYAAWAASRQATGSKGPSSSQQPAVAAGGVSSSSSGNKSSQQQQQQAGQAQQPSQQQQQRQQRRQQPAPSLADPQPLMPPVAPMDPAAIFLHAAHQYTFPFSGAPVLKTASVVAQLEAASVAQHTANPQHHWLPPTLTGERDERTRYEDGLEALLPDAGWGAPRRGGWGAGKPAARRNNMLSSSGYAVDGAVNTSGDPVVDLQQELQLPPQAVINAQTAFAASFTAWGGTLHRSSLTAAGLQSDDISASQELLASPAVTRLTVTLALYVWMDHLLHTHQADAGIMRGACGHVNTLQAVGRGKRRNRRPTPKDTLEAWDLGWQMLKQIRTAAAAAAAAAAGVSAQPSAGGPGGGRYGASSAGFMASSAGAWEDCGASSAGALQQPSSLTAAAVSSLGGPSGGARSRAGSIDGRSVAAPSMAGGRGRKLNRMFSAASSASSGMTWSPSNGGMLGGEEAGEGGGLATGALGGRALAPVVASTPEQQMAELLDLQECREAALLKAWHTLCDRLKQSQAGLTLCLPLLLLFLRSLLPGTLKQQYPSWYRSPLGAEGLKQLDALILSLLDPHGFFQQIPLMQGSKAALQMRHGLQWQQKMAVRSVSIAAAAARSGVEDEGGSEWEGMSNQGAGDALGSCKGAGGAGGQPQVSPIVTRAVGAAGSPKARQLLGAAACKAASKKPLLSADGSGVGAGNGKSGFVTVAEKAQMDLAEQAMSRMALAGVRGGKTELCGRLRSELHNSRCFS